MTEINKIDDKKRRILISIIVIILFLVLVGGTFAYIIFGLDVFNGNYIAKTQCFNIVYDNKNKDGTMDIEGTLVPSTDYSGGISGSMALGVDENCPISAYGNLFVHLNNSDSILTQQVEPHCEDAKTLETLVNYTEEQCNSIDGAVWVTSGSALKYMVFEEGNSNAVSVGYIDKVNEDIKIYSDFRIRNKVNETTGELELSKYTIYIWLDFNISDSSYSFASFSGYMYADASQIAQPNKPELDSGMIPVTIADDGTVTTVSPDDPNWYNYENKEWANVVLVTNESRSNYKNNIGKTVSQGDILAYYVWIPRYKYRINGSSETIPDLTCGDVENPTRKEYPMCYYYNITGTDREKLVNSVHQDMCFDRGTSVSNCNPSLRDEDIVNQVEELLSGGTIYLYSQDLSFDLENYIIARGLDITLENENYSFVSDKLLESSHTNPPLTDILFESKSSIRVFGDAVETYYSHPAFWWDDDNDGIVDNNEILSGIWVGKFESNPEKNSECLTKLEQIGDSTDETVPGLCNNSTQNPTILPNVTSLRYQNVKNQFLTSRNISKNGNIYGLNNETINAHLMKNRDWGAVVYLSNSIYGKASGVKQNANARFRTGCGPTSPSSKYNGYPTIYECQNKYGTVTRYLQSTTGNITGIFDMAGGSYDRVMGYYGDTINDNYDSGFEELPELKYYDLYFETNFDSNCPLETCEGHALNNGFGGIAGFGDSYPWVTRGGMFYGSNIYIWNASGGSGGAMNNVLVSWRSVLVPGFGN